MTSHNNRYRLLLAACIAAASAACPSANAQDAQAKPDAAAAPAQQAAPQTPPAQQPAAAPKIVDIIVLGNKSLNRESIIAASGLKIGDPLTQASLDEAKRRLVATGNFGANKPDPSEGINIRADIDQVQNTAKVVIDVSENDRIQGINITGSGPIPPAVILSKISTSVGSVLNLPALQRDVTTIRNMYEEKGYQAFVSEDLGMTNGILNIPIVVGKIHDVNVKGLKKTKKWVVTREMKQKTGAYYNVVELRKDLTRILNTDLFENVEPAFSFPSPGQVDVTLNVQEKRTGTVELAVGYGSNGVVGRAGIGENNFLGRGQQINLQWETGGLANRNSFEVDFTEPWLDKKNTSLSLSLFDKTVYRFAEAISSVTSTTSNTPNGVYYEVHQGGQLTLSRPFGTAYRAFVGFRYDDIRVPFVPLDVNSQAVLQNGPLSVVNLRLTHNTRDFDLEPAVGGYEAYTGDIGTANISPLNLGNGQRANTVSGRLNFTKFGVDARRYFSPQGRRINPRDKRRVFAIRLMGGSSTGTLPFSELYFVGGAESLRGYREDRFWGSNMFLASAEYRHPLANSLTGVLFVDVGDAWGGPYQNVNIQAFTQPRGFQANVGFGLGLRVITPIGPIRIDEGFGSEGARTHFSIGHVF